jgi:hypothetical protein
MRAARHAALIDELGSFPLGRHDMVDALSPAFNVTQRAPTRISDEAWKLSAQNSRLARLVIDIVQDDARTNAKAHARLDRQ